jgi:hypothetical protein
MQPKPTVARSAEQKQLREHEAQCRRLSGLLVGRAKSIGADKLCRVASVKPQLNQQNQKSNRHHDARIASLIAPDQEFRVKAQN